MTIHSLFEAQVQRTPAAPALIFPNLSSTIRTLTYQELNRKANRLARYLQTSRAGLGTLVGVCMEPSLERVVALLAILKAGGAYVPLDPAYPAERLAFMLADSQVPLLLTQPHLAESLPGHEAKVIMLDASASGLEQYSDHNLSAGVQPDHPAYVIYTSGSTGTPKGVVGLHRGAVNRFQWMWAAYPFMAGEICCQKTALSFVDSIWEIFGPLLQGIPGLVFPGEIARNPELLVEALMNHKVSRLVLVPSLLRVILEMPEKRLAGLSALKIWVASGETLPLELAHQFHHKLPGRLLLNFYGSSEVSADATWYETYPDEHYSSVPIGYPIANTQVYILDAEARPVSTGELYIGGTGLAQGYLNRPDLTAEKFIPDPFSDQMGARLYKTGDLARWLPEGNLEFLGRVDHQVKIRGFRVELGEIEAALTQHPNVRENVVIASTLRQDTHQERLIAYIVPEPHATLSSHELRQFLEKKLPDYMVPSAFVSMAALPLTPNGKIDRQALPQPGRSGAGTPFVGPRTPVERTLAHLWAELLGLEKVGVDDQFLELGGHSLLAAQLVARLRQTFQVEVPVGQLFEVGTVAALAEQVELAFWVKTSQQRGLKHHSRELGEAEGARDEGVL